MHDESEPLFHSADAAVRWALSDDRVALQQVSTYRSPGSGRGLAGFDGAGQAGIILSHIHRLAMPKADIITAQILPVKRPCGCRRDCCSGWTTHQPWTHAVETVAMWWEGKNDNRRPRLLRGCLRRFFGENVSIEALAKRASLHRATVSEFNGEVLKSVKPLKEAAWRELDESLTASGIVGSSQSAAA